MKSEFKGDILAVRGLEDCIRATRKYTKGAFSKSQNHSAPIQGADFPSRVLTEYYEVYPDIEMGSPGMFWDMHAGDFWKWIWRGDAAYIDVRFYYNYPENWGRMVVRGGDRALRELSAGIPSFKEALSHTTEVMEGKPEEKHETDVTGAPGAATRDKQVVGPVDGVGASVIPHPQ